MPKGPNERFFVELVPDFDQKKKWASIEKQTADLISFFRGEISRQVEILGTPMAKNLYLESKGGEDLAPDLVEPARSGIKSQTHDLFRSDVKQRRGKKEFFLEIRKEDVIFSIEAKVVRVPYLGLIRHRGNKKILPNMETENAAWIMGSITSMALAVKNQYLWLVMDAREDPSRKRPPSRSRRKGKMSKWLT